MRHNARESFCGGLGLLHLPVLGLLSCLLAACGGAESDSNDVPGLGSGYFYYASSKRGSITVSFRSRRPDIKSDERDTITLPRSYVYYVDGYQRRAALPYGEKQEITYYRALPDNVVTTGRIMLLVASPGGEPFMLKGRSEDFPTGYDPRRNGGSPRRDIIAVELMNGRNVRQAFREARAKRIGGVRAVGASEVPEFGLMRVGTSNSPVFYHDDYRDNEFLYVSCLNSSNELAFCDTYIVLSDRYVAIARFVDFRFAGGLPFLKARVRAVRNAICPYLKCD